MRTLMSARLAQFILAIFTFGFLVGYQNCGPVQFSKSNLSADKVTTSGGGDPNNCDGGTCNPPEYNCSGFSTNSVTTGVIPVGQTTIPITFSGNLGHAAPPMKWTWSWTSGVPTPSGNGSGIGTHQSNGNYTFTQNLGVGSYDMTVWSGDLACWQTMRFSIRQGTNECPTPSATQIIASVSPTQLVLSGKPLSATATLTISNFSQLTNVQATWDGGTTWENLSSGTVTHTFTQAGNYHVMVKANDQTCNNALASDLGNVRVDPPACVPEPTSILFTKTSTSPDEVGSPITWTISNWWKNPPAMSLRNFTNVSVDFGDGTSSAVTGPTFSHTYNAPSPAAGYLVNVTGTEQTCQTPASGHVNIVIKPTSTCVPTLTVNDINVSYTAAPASTTPGVNFYTNSQVSFNVSNPSQWAAFSWQMSNGSAGNTAVISPPSYRFPNEGSVSLVVSARGPGQTTCGNTLTKTFSYNVRHNTQSFQFLIGSNEVKPPVKLFFIVDNSKTMLNKQNRLAAAYQSMFATAGSSLVGFDVTSYIINTAQYTIPKALPYNPGNTPLNYYLDNATGIALNVLEQMYPRVSNDYWAQNYSLSALTSQFRAANSIGSIAGDVLGVRNSFPGYVNAQSPTAQYEVAPVTKFENNPSTSNGRPLVVKTNIKIGPNASAAEIQQMATDFQQRVALLNPNLYVNNTNPNYEAVTLAESGHCAIARVLRESNRYLAAGDKPAFIIVSDENDAFTSGTNCVYQSGQVTKYIGRCEKPGTRFSYDSGDSCERRYALTSSISFDQKVTPYSYTHRRQVCHGTDTGTVCEWETTSQSGNAGGWPSSVPANTPTSSLPVSVSAAQCRSFLNLVDTASEQFLNITCSANKASQVYNGYPATAPGQTCTPPSIYLGTYIAGSCQVLGYYSFASDSVPIDPGFTCTQANAPHYCVNSNGSPLPGCTLSVNTETHDFVEPVAALQCNSACVAGGHCSNQTYNSYIQTLGGQNCQVSNANYVASQITQYVIDDGNVCPAGQTFVHTAQQVSQSTDYVGGKLSNGAPQNLKTYITNQLATLETAHVLKATATAFVYRPSEFPSCNPTTGNNCPGVTDPGTSMDQQYGPLLNAINGNSNLDRYFRIDTTDYSPALAQVSTFISNQLIRTYTIPNLNTVGLVIDSVRWKGQLLTTPAQYTVNGATIIFNDSLPVVIGDSIVVTYHYQ